MDVEKVIENFILEELLMSDGDAGLGYDQLLISSGILDSLPVLRMVAFIEDQFGVQVEDGDVVPDNFETIARMAAYVEERI